MSIMIVMILGLILMSVVNDLDSKQSTILLFLKNKGVENERLKKFKIRI